ncbi:ABC transporter substrate-binding protein [Pseudomonas stutzeri]|uniref:Branched-chain amino acid ABC transporter substrate-binding protein n=1 Tax=Stutzerimonas stutzeri KOS6 TaxID=1218352 RepID=A0A061JP77_STUST|nr:ABC transporter substrate-binding protein [Stutzerimonas stutzeri]EWC40393.1 branched-chain amino acid ABC transporter substrate-binding protein [Stutzerimonas stutzeri KOS6]MBK3867214.1 ABC transporter substrate-binding protein [Stutzerimonas stutzeri]
MFRPSLVVALLAFALQGAHAGEPIRLGLNYPGTGNYKSEGLELRRGALLAVDQINQHGGLLGRRLELVGRNSAAREEKALGNVEHFASMGAAMIFGGANSEEALSAGQRARELGLLYFPTLGYANEITGRDGHRHLFRESNSAWMSARVLGEYLSWHMPNRRYHYISLDDAWGRSMEQALREATKSRDRARHGYSKIAERGARRDDYLAALQKAAASDADVLVIVLLGQDLVQTMRLAHTLELGKRMQIIVPNLTQSIVEQAGPLVMENVIGTEAWTWRVPQREQSEEGQAFVDRYIAQHQAYPGSTAASAYGIVRQWAAAVQRAGNLDSEAVITALENHRYRLLKDEQYWRDFDHQNVQSIYAVRVKDRSEIMRDRFKQDYFDIIHRMDGEEAAPSLDDWQQERGELLQLQ